VARGFLTNWTEIVAQASNYEEPTTVQCRRRPNRRPCGGRLTLFFDADTFDVLWFCTLAPAVRGVAEIRDDLAATREQTKIRVAPFVILQTDCARRHNFEIAIGAGRLRSHAPTSRSARIFGRLKSTA